MKRVFGVVVGMMLIGSALTFSVESYTPVPNDYKEFIGGAADTRDTMTHTFEITECFFKKYPSDPLGDIICLTTENTTWEYPLDTNFNAGFRGTYKGMDVLIQAAGKYNRRKNHVQSDPGSNFRMFDPKLVVQETKLNLSFKGDKGNQASTPQVAQQNDRRDAEQQRQLQLPTADLFAIPSDRPTQPPTRTQPSSRVVAATPSSGASQVSTPQQQTSVSTSSTQATKPPEKKDLTWCVRPGMSSDSRTEGLHTLKNNCTETVTVYFCYSGYANPDFTSVFKCPSLAADEIQPGREKLMSFSNGASSVRYAACSKYDYPSEWGKQPWKVPMCK